MNKFLIAGTIFLFSLFALVIKPAVGYAAPCTPGTNCYCDKVKGGAFNDPSVLLCEDFEAPTLINNQGVGNGAPYYGPWYDDSGQAGNRGINSYWNRKYGNGVNGFLFSTGQPASPLFGSSCNFPLCSGARVWDAENRWSANAYDPRLMFPSKASDFSAEVTSILPPTNTASGAAGVFDGNASLAWRIGPANNNGIAGAARWNRVTTFGATQAVAYPNNLGTSGIANNMWKHNQWLSDSSQAGGDALFLFGRTGTLDTTFPFYQMTFADYSQTQAVRTSNCAARLAAAVKTIGSFRCDPEGNFIWEPASSNYSRPIDWPLGTWGCAEAYYQNMGATNSAIQMWFTGPSGVRKKLIDISGMDLTGHAANYKGVAGYVGLSWNAYANANAGAQYGSVANTETTFRYEDNLHIRAGAPVSCAQIGFVAGTTTPTPPTPPPTPTPDTTPPSTPTSLTISAISPSQINLSWTASTDNTGVTGYRIYRNGTQIATTATNSYSNTSLTPSTAYSYTVSAYDTSNNASTQSSSASATTQAPPVVATTPVGSWSFDTADLTTTTTLDRSGLNHTLTLINTPARVTGKVNQALSFDGISSTASCTDAACGGTTKLDMGTSDWTTSAWVKTSPAATGNIVTKSGFICGGNPDGWTVYVSSTGKLQAALHDSVAGCLFSANDGTTINDGTWHLTTTVFNRAGNLVRYVDGIQTGTATSIASLNGASIDSTSEFRIGSRDATGDSGFLSGAIDEVKVYPRALSLTEIQALYAAGTSVSPTPDTTAPSTPTNLTATAISTTQINLSWTASTDNVGVSGYRIYRSGTQIATTATNSYSNTSLTPSTAYSYTIAAYDAAGNTSVQSAGASATTQSASVTTTTTTTNTSPTNTTTSTNTSTANTSTNTTSPAGGSSGGVGSSVTTPATSSIYTPSSSQTTSTTPVTPSLSLTRTLYQGAKGTDVKNLQTFLISSGYLAPSNTTGFYGPLTTQAVQKYQCAQNIVCSGTQTSTGYGMVGLKTRAKLNGSSSSYVSTSTLTPAQADSIIALLQSFGADAAVIARVKVVLGR